MSYHKPNNGIGFCKKNKTITTHKREQWYWNKEQKKKNEIGSERENIKIKAHWESDLLSIIGVGTLKWYWGR